MSSYIIVQVEILKFQFGSESYRLIWFHSIEIPCSFSVCYSSTRFYMLSLCMFHSNLNHSLCNQKVRLVATEFFKLSLFFVHWIV